MSKLNGKLSNFKFGKILDIATRDGAFIKRLSKNLHGYDEIIGIDISSEGFEKARKNFAEDKRIKFEIMDGYNTSFPDNYFDLVCISNSLHHVEDINALLKEMVRIKKDDGFILISELPADGQTGASLTHAMIHELDCMIDTHHGIYHHPTYSHKEIVEFLEEAGINIVDDFDDLEIDLSKNSKLIPRVEKALIKVEECKNADNHEELYQMAININENYSKYGANTAIQYIIFGK